MPQHSSGSKTILILIWPQFHNLNFKFGECTHIEILRLKRMHLSPAGGGGAKLSMGRLKLGANYAIVTLVNTESTSKY